MRDLRDSQAKWGIYDYGKEGRGVGRLQREGRQFTGRSKEQCLVNMLYGP